MKNRTWDKRFVCLLGFESQITGTGHMVTLNLQLMEEDLGLSFVH
jgi:hypothetical protein